MNILNNIVNDINYYHTIYVIIVCVICTLFITSIYIYCIICTDVLCTNNSHIDSIQKLHDDLISASICASDCIPNTGQSKRKMPGWDITVSHAREIALFWRSIWINLNSPRTHSGGYYAQNKSYISLQN